MTDRRHVARHIRERRARPAEPTIDELKAKWFRMGVMAKQERREVDIMPDGLPRLERLVLLYAYLIEREDVAMRIDAKLARYGRTS